MNMYFRLFLLWIKALRSKAPSIGILDETTLKFRCGLSDIDLYRHMNNAKYLSFMDLGRIHFIGSIGAFDLVRKYRWLTIVGGADIEYRRAIELFSTFELKTRLLAWDNRWFYHEQTISSNGKVAAVAYVRVLLLGPDKKIVPPSEALSLLGVDSPSPALTERLAGWKALWSRPTKKLDASVGSEAQ
jgi:acyl-CoA thioesterase FadM